MSTRSLRVAVFVCLVATCAFAQPTPIRIGESAPEFSLLTLRGATVSSTSLAGHPVVLVFGATWCPYSKRVADSLASMYDVYRKRGVHMYYVNIKEDRTKATAMWLDQKHVPFPVLHDNDGAVALSFLPADMRTGEKAIQAMLARAVVIDAAGKIAAFDRPTRGTPDLELIRVKSALDVLLATAGTNQP